MSELQQQELASFAIIFLVAVIIYARPRWHGSGTAFGTARFANARDLRAANLFAKRGLILGRTKRDGRLLRMCRFVHLAIFSPAGGGKSTSFCIPWLLTESVMSMVVLDLKGELFRLTAAVRRAMGHTVIRLDPFAVCGKGSDTFNPFDLADDGLECVEDARPMAEAMVTRTGEEKDPHFNDQAANLITGVVSYILADLQPEQRNLSSLREIVTQLDLSEAAVAAMQNKGGVFARMAGVIAQLEDKEKASVYSTVHRHTTYADSPAIIANTSSSSFDARQLLTGKMTIYLILPPHQLEAQARWLRLVIASLIRLIAREGTQENP